MAELPLIRRSLIEHEALISEANVPELLRRTGWIKLYRSDATLANAVRDLERAKQYGVAGEVLDAPGDRRARTAPDRRLRRRGASSCARLCSRSRRSGQGLCGVVRPQGRPLSGRRWTNARAIRHTLAGGNARRHRSRRARSSSRMGPWSDQIFAPLGYSIPLNVKRGYHLHLTARGNAVLNHPVLDSDLGYLLAPMNRGIRLTTGVEFARRDAPPTPVQVERALPRAHALFPLGRSGRPQALEGRAALPAGYAAGDREGAPPCRVVVQFRPPAPRPDAWTCNRPPVGRNDDRRDAICRYQPFCRGTIWLTMCDDWGRSLGNGLAWD